MKVSRIPLATKLLLAVALQMLPGMSEVTPVLPVLLKNEEYKKTLFRCMVESINDESTFFVAGHAKK